MSVMNKDQRGISLITTLLAFTLISAFLAAVGLVLSQERARVRDSRRMVDMVRVQFAFETLFREKASYAEAASGCDQAGKSVSTCTLSTYLPNIENLKDPNGKEYRVEQVPDDKDFAISFVLERGYETLVAGKHFVTRNGIQ